MSEKKITVKLNKKKNIINIKSTKRLDMNILVDVLSSLLNYYNEDKIIVKEDE